MANFWQAFHQAEVNRQHAGLDSSTVSEAEVRAIMQRDQAALVAMANAQAAQIAAAAASTDPDAGLSAAELAKAYGL
jgi:hypothetical protein